MDITRKMYNILVLTFRALWEWAHLKGKWVVVIYDKHALWNISVRISRNMILVVELDLGDYRLVEA